MKLAIHSDLHLEFGWEHDSIRNDSKADVLILAGDIFTAADLHAHDKDHPIVQVKGVRMTSSQKAAHFRSFIDRVCSEYDCVLYVAGNHEFYNFKWHQTIPTVRANFTQYKNFHVLENEQVVINGIRFLGATLWTALENPIEKIAVENGMNDFRVIRDEQRGYGRIRYFHPQQRHYQARDFFRSQLQESVMPTIIVSHHAPCNLSISEEYKGDILSAGYFTNLTDMMLDNDHLIGWVHGHVHNSNDYVINNCRVISHPRGYRVGDSWENTQWDPNFYVTF